MNPRSTTIPATNAPLFLLAAEPSSYLDAGFTAGLQDLYSHEMDRAIGLEQASLAAALRMQAGIVDLFEHAAWTSPVLRTLLDVAAQAIKDCLDLQLAWLAAMAPHAVSRPEASCHLVELRRRASSGFGGQAGMAAEEFERSMDIAIGAEGFECNMDKAMAARAA